MICNTSLITCSKLASVVLKDTWHNESATKFCACLNVQSIGVDNPDEILKTPNGWNMSNVKHWILSCMLQREPTSTWLILASILWWIFKWDCLQCHLLYTRDFSECLKSYLEMCLYHNMFFKIVHLFVVVLIDDQIIWNHVKYFIIHIFLLQTTTLFNTPCTQIHIYMLQRTFKVQIYNKFFMKWNYIFLIELKF